MSIDASDLVLCEFSWFVNSIIAIPRVMSEFPDPHKFYRCIRNSAELIAQFLESYSCISKNLVLIFHRSQYIVASSRVLCEFSSLERFIVVSARVLCEFLIVHNVY
jgi:hypothetical protein